MEPTVRYKLLRGETRDLGDGRAEAVMSSEARDRDGDIIRADGWDLANFLKHPVLLSSHNYFALRSQIGQWEDVRVESKKLVGVARYYVGDGNEEADWGYKLAQRGMAAFSVGFLPDMGQAKQIDNGPDALPSWEFRAQELLETSQVTIPANPQALQRMKGLDLHPVLASLVTEALGEPGRKAEMDEDKMAACMGHLMAAMGLMEDMMGEGAGERARLLTWTEADIERLAGRLKGLLNLQVNPTTVEPSRAAPVLEAAQLADAIRRVW